MYGQCGRQRLSATATTSVTAATASADGWTALNWLDNNVPGLVAMVQREAGAA
jgi:hypothetical protein